MGDMFCNMQFELGGAEDLLSAVAYISGIAFLGQGVQMLIRYHDNPQSTPLHHPLTRIGGGSALIAAPSVATAIVDSLFAVNGGGGLLVCVPGQPTPTQNGTGLDTLVTNLILNIKDPLTFFISVIAILIGTYMIVHGLIKASKYGIDPREHSVGKIVANLLVGAILLVVGQSSDTLMNTLFGFGGPVDSSVVTQWAIVQQLNAGTQFVTAIQAAILFFELIGMIAFVRGWMIIKKAAEGSGQATMAQGITHVFGGVLAMNLFGFLEVMDATFGTNFL